MPLGAASARIERILERVRKTPDGSLAQGDRQRQLLAAEGVPFRGARVDMSVARIPEL
ncbi:MAG: MGMT family protein [Solirubrobacteraceae bacterium]